jgi:hypothetical protein
MKTIGRRIMAAKAKKKPHDLRDDIWAPRTTVTRKTDGRRAGEPDSVDREERNPEIVSPAVGRNVTPGQTTKG